MYIFFWPFLFLPIIEIIGFVTIGAKLGAGMTLLWLFAAGWGGFYLLQSRGKSAWVRAQKAQEDDIFAMRDLFDGIAILIASLLLIFPGFISDFLAVPFLLAPLRNWIFDTLGKNPNGAVRTFTKRTVDKSMVAKATTAKSPTVIDAEYKEIDDK